MDGAASSPQSPARGVLAALREVLDPLLGERLSDGAAVREHHGRGEGMRDLAPPDLVAFPVDEAEVSAILGACHRLGVPVIPFGAGSSLEGHVAAIHGGLCLDLTRMDAILQVNANDLDCRVQAGVTRLQLNAALRDQGLFFPLDPGADATLGGMAATRASGTNAVRYGTMREVTLGLTVVTPQGRVIRTGGRARKSAAGYDLTRLYLGSEGTLGVIAELQLKLFGIPETVMAAACQFADLESAIGAVMTAMQMGLPLARIELLDAMQMRASIRYSHLTGFEEKPSLFLEFHGGPQAVAEQIAQIRAVADDWGGSAFQWAEREEDRSRLWKARHDAYFSSLALAPGKAGFATDACVPISALADCILRCRAMVETAGLMATIVGHVGDGNFHVLLLHDANDPADRARAERLARAIARTALDYGGTCTGEHGIGMHKLDLLGEEHGEGVEVMRAIKAALDPKGIMNPGKVLRP